MFTKSHIVRLAKSLPQFFAPDVDCSADLFAYCRIPYNRRVFHCNFHRATLDDPWYLTSFAWYDFTKNPPERCVAIATSSISLINNGSADSHVCYYDREFAKVPR